ncbi:MAG: RdgB/HAM1 family non-canonical purine NTP pyrophosphatase [Dehalococcoidia bacterium]|nr:RdgB/HAM1 family non-canonical purine NTP pyrophosphatase [Dehalococcoidia bacterium]
MVAPTTPRSGDPISPASHAATVAAPGDRPRRLVLGTGNASKVREIRAILGGSGWELLTPSEAGVDIAPVAETGRSYVENAVAKATAYVRASGLPSLADDSGLEVDALGGRPGVLSARYGGPGMDDQRRYERLLEELAGVPLSRRTARFRATVAVARPGNQPIVREGVVEGRIALEPRGANGFGYDPVFLLPGGQTMAELGDEKQRISHRALALAALRDVLRDLNR